jgi:hypothetical protein
MRQTTREAPPSWHICSTRGFRQLLWRMRPSIHPMGQDLKQRPALASASRDAGGHGLQSRISPIRFSYRPSQHRSRSAVAYLRVQNGSKRLDV